MASHDSVKLRSRDLKPAYPRLSLRAPMVAQVQSLQHVILGAAAVTGLVVTMTLSGSGFAAALAPGKPIQSFAGEFVKDLIYKGMAVFEDPRLAPAERYGRFTRLIEQNLDIQKIARFTLGRYWNSASEKER